jgi:hypothetical protein
LRRFVSHGRGAILDSVPAAEQESCELHLGLLSHLGQ